MHRLPCTGILVMLFVLSPLATHAYPSLMGTTGSANLPLADMAPPHAVSLACDLQKNSSGTSKSWRVLYGLSERCEVGASYVDTSRHTYGVSVKYQLAHTEDSATAIGVMGAKTSRFTIGPSPPINVARDSRAGGLPMVLPETNTYQGYLVHTRALRAEDAEHVGIRISVGANYTAMAPHSDEQQALRAFASLGIVGGDGAAYIDLQTADENIDYRPMLSLVGRYRLTKWASATRWACWGDRPNASLVVSLLR